jgi:hypothetical protein
MRRTLVLVVMLLLATFLLPDNVSAQYFGQNKVRHENLDFKVLKTEHFDIYYYDEEAAVVPEVGRMAERWYARLSAVLDHQLSSRQPVIIYASHPPFRATTVIPDVIGETTGGVTEGLRRRVVLPFAGPLKETDHVLGHELVHAFQYDIARGGDAMAAAALPLWFIEGMAEYLSVGSTDSQTAMWLRDAVRRDKLPDIDHLDDPAYFPYRFGQAFWAFVAGKYGDEVIGRILRSAVDSGDPTAAIGRTLSMNPNTLSQEWHAELRKEYEPVIQATTPPVEVGATVIEAKESREEINVGPALSPDGSRMIFFSERDLFSIDLYVANARTGEIEDKVTETSLDPHVDSLQFVNSAGDWSRDGQRIAFGSIRDGRPEVSIYNVEKKKVDRRISLPKLGEIHNLTWAPDGQSLAFSGMSGAVTDIFLLDLKTENVRQLTNDAFADLQPAWSPDGTRIAFVTDRFTSDLATLSFGAYRLGLLNPQSGQIEALAAFQNGAHINPQWSSDSQSIYFISDRNGIPNIYRLARQGGALYQVTDLQTGVSGITQLSPALSVASSGNGIIFSSFSDGMYSLRRLDGPAQVAGIPVTTPGPREGPAVLPPRSSAEGEVAGFLRNPLRGLRPSREFTSEKYKPRLSLDYVAPPSVEVGVSNFGSVIGGGTTLGWSDLLGRHNLTTTFQTTFSTESGNFFNNLAVLAGYQNERHRWTWGITGGQVPYISGDFSRTLVSVDGTPVVVDRSMQFWQVNRELIGYVAYPISRAQRVEFSTGFRRIGFDSELRTEVFDLATGELVAEETEEVESPGALNLGTAATALVYDTSIFGGTSPIRGRRYRFEVGTTAGSMKYQTFLADFRQYYQIARPLSLAGRVLHFGRYGNAAEDPRLGDLFLGQDSLVRGYTSGSFSASECRPAIGAIGGCPVFDQLLGSRFAVANAEVRMPVFGALGVVRSPKVPPVEAALFFDAGVAWTSFDKASFLGGSRRPVTSHGASLRVNLLGFAIAQMNLAHPNDRPGRGWVWEFSLLPGF